MNFLKEVNHELIQYNFLYLILKMFLFFYLRAIWILLGLINIAKSLTKHSISYLKIKIC